MFNNNSLTFFNSVQSPLMMTNSSTVMEPISQISPDLYFQSPLNTCFHVTPELIKQRFIGNPSKENTEKITAAIMEVLNIDPVINDYISIVFNHLLGFQLMTVPIKDIEKVRESEKKETIAGYASGARTLLLPCDSPQELSALIRHEFRHSVMHTIQMSRSDSNTILTTCHFPLIKSEQIKVAGYLESGDRRVQNLALLLKQEGEYRLSKTDREYLKKLRESSQKLYEKHYGGTDLLSLYKYQSLEEAQKNWPIGQTYQIEFESGLIHTAIVIGYGESENKMCPYVKIVDCLASLAIKTFIIKREIKIYEPHRQLEEREAYIYGDIPPPLIKEFYPELFNYGEGLIQETFFDRSIYSKPIVNYSLSQMLQATYESIFLIPPESLNPLLVDGMFDFIKIYITHSEKLDECQALLKTIINKGHRVANANACLARIGHLHKDYKTACLHYKRAAKGGHRFNIDEMLLYASSLYETGEYKTSEKLCKQALRLNGNALTTPKRELFEKILETIRSRYQSPYSYAP